MRPAGTKKASRYYRHQPLTEVGERLASDLNYLIDASNILISSLDRREMFNRLATLIVPFMADWCTVGAVKVENQEIERVGFMHKDPAISSTIERMIKGLGVAMNVHLGIGQLIQNKKSILVPRVNVNDFIREFLSEFPNAAERITSEALKQSDIASYLGIPLVAQGKVLGAISMIRGSDRPPFDPIDLSVGDELGKRAALALDVLNRLDRALSERERTTEIVALFWNFLSSRIEDSKVALTAARLKAELLIRRQKTSTKEQKSDLELLQGIPADIDRANVVISDILASQHRLDKLLS